MPADKTMWSVDDDRRCPWSTGSDLMRRYHDERWCKPTHDETELFAMLVLEGMQAGLSWSLILEREPLIRKACDGLDPTACAGYGQADEARLLSTDGMIKNRLKVRSIGQNARAFRAVQEEFGSFDAYIWGFTGGEVIDHRFESQDDYIASDDLSEKVSKDLKKRGFKFVGPTIVYSYLQGIGVINDHLLMCRFR